MKAALYVAPGSDEILSTIAVTLDTDLDRQDRGPAESVIEIPVNHPAVLDPTAWRVVNGVVVPRVARPN